jgi:hypothetical protein
MHEPTRMKSGRDSPSRRTRQVLVTIETIVGLGALYGGIGLLRDADGFGAKRAWLDGSVFPDYTVPGLVLAVVIGGGMLAAAAITATASRSSAPWALAMGLVLLSFGTVETLTLGYVGGAQVALLAAFVVAPGVALSVVGARGLRRTGKPQPTGVTAPDARARPTPHAVFREGGDKT